VVTKSIDNHNCTRIHRNTTTEILKPLPQSSLATKDSNKASQRVSFLHLKKKKKKKKNNDMIVVMLITQKP